jgi:hypothetical protein
VQLVMSRNLNEVQGIFLSKDVAICSPANFSEAEDPEVQSGVEFRSDGLEINKFEL